MSRHRIWLVFLTAAVFAPSLGGDFVWDDNVLIRDNRLVHSLSGLRGAFSSDFWLTSDPDVSAEVGFYRPLVKSAFVLEYWIFHGQSWGFRLVNLLLHLACVLLLHQWLRRRLSTWASPAQHEWGAFAGALLFAVHPSRAESVAWIAGSTDLWMAFFALLCLVLWDRRDRPSQLASSAAAAAASALSKEAALALPLALVLDLWVRGEKKPGDLLRWLAPTGAMGAVSIARWAFVPFRHGSIFAGGPIAALTRVLSTYGYLALTVLAPVHPSVLSGSFQTLPKSWIALGAALGIGLVGLLIASVRREALRPVASDLLFFAVLLLPAANLLPLNYRFLASERFLYLPLIGICSLVARGIRSAAGAAPFRRWSPPWLLGLLIGMIAITSAHAIDFTSDLSLWTHERSLHPDDPYAAQMLARAQWSSGELPQAAEQASEALQRSIDETDRLSAAILLAEILQEAAADSDLAPLRSLAEFFDRLDRPSGIVMLGYHGRRWELDPPPELRRRAALGYRFQLNRAILHARLHDWAIAESVLGDLCHRYPDRPSACGNLSRLRGLRGLGSPRPLSGQDRGEGAKQDLQIEPERP